MAFLTSKDGTLASARAVATNDGIPYVWNSGDVTTVPSNETKLVTTDVPSSGSFGWSVSVGSGRIVVGAYLDDDNGSLSGSAYLYDLDGNLIKKITAFNGTTSDQFGTSVSVGCGRLIIGQPQTGFGASDGVAYLYDTDGNYITTLEAPDGATNDAFGFSVSIGSGRIAVGAFQDDDSGSSSGSVYLFDLNGDYLKKITASDGAADDDFGYSVSIGSGRLVVGSYGDDDNGPQSGSAYIFDSDGNYITKVTAPDGTDSDRFGYSVCAGSGRIVSGAYLHDANGASSGSAYVFDLDGNYITKLLAPDGTDGDNFGNSVSVGSGRIAVGAPADDDNGSSSGSVYLFDLDGKYITKITSSDGAANDFFGSAVAVGSGIIVSGAYGDDDPSSGSGSAYIYETPQVYTIYDAIELDKGYL